MRKQLTAATLAAVAALSIGAGAALASTGGHPHGKADPVAVSKDRATSRDRASRDRTSRDTIRDRTSRDTSRDRTSRDRAGSSHTAEHVG